MVAEFFASNDNFTAAEIRGAKEQSAGRETYGDHAISYVQLKRSDNICIVKCKMCPEYKVCSKLYNVTTEVDEIAENIVNVTCHDCAASSGGCKHAVAFLMWLHRRSEEPAPTDVDCYWKKSTLASVGTSLKFKKVCDFGHVKETSLPNYTQGTFRKEFIDISHARGDTTQITKYFNELPLKEKLGMHYLICKFSETGDTDCANFLNFAKQSMTFANCMMACNSTMTQSISSLWHDL